MSDDSHNGIHGRVVVVRPGEYNLDGAPAVDERELGKIYHVKLPLIPDVRFEWHPKKRIVYLIRVGPAQEVAEPIAWDVATHGGAINCVLIWGRGYHARRLEVGTV